MDANLPPNGNLPPPHGYGIRISANLSTLGYLPPLGRVNREVGMDANRPPNGNLPPPHSYKIKSRISAIIFLSWAYRVPSSSSGQS